MTTATFLLIDGYSLAFRAFFGMPDSLRDPQGEAVHAVYGFFSVLFNRIGLMDATYVAVAWDVGRPWREEIFPAYKAGRQEIDPSVEVQVERIKPVLTAMRLKQYEATGYEADDIIATLARLVEAHDEAVHTIILSGDRDLFGTISPSTTVLYPTRSMNDAELYTAEKLWTRWAILPRQVGDFKAMVGDASDNIPGVRGIGEKGAAKLLAEYGTLDAIYENLAAIKPERTRLALENGRDSAYLSQRLATLVADVPNITFEPSECALQYDPADVDPLWDALGFQQLRTKMPITKNNT